MATKGAAMKSSGRVGARLGGSAKAVGQSARRSLGRSRVVVALSSKNASEGKSDLSAARSEAEALGLGQSRRELLAQVGCGAAALSSALALGPGAAFAEDAGGDDDLLPVSALPKGAKASQLQEVNQLVKDAVRKCVTEDYTKLLQLAFIDAIAYDKTGGGGGGANGSVRNEGELKALGVTGLDQAVAQVTKAKEEAEKTAPFPLALSWADTLYLAAYYKTQRHFIDSVFERAKDTTSANIILQGYSNDFPVPPIGRVDASASDSTATLSLKATDLVQRGLDNGLLAGQMAALAVCFPNGQTLDQNEAEISELGGKFAFYVKSYQKSRTELTQTNYQIDLGTALFKLSTLGATITPDRYYRPVPKPSKQIKKYVK